MIKVCHLTSAHNSGDIRILKKQCVSLAKKSDYDVYLIAKGDSYTFKGVNVIGVEVDAANRIDRVLKVSKRIVEEALALDADVYQLHDPELLLYAKKLKKSGKKVIFDSHEDTYAQIMEKDYIPKALRGIIAAAYRMFENRACRFMDGAIFPCPINGRHIFENRVKNWEYIDNLPLMEEVEFMSKAVEGGGENKTPAVCCVGSLTQKRGIEELINGCYEAGVKLILAGAYSPASFGEHLIQQESYKIVDFRGYCTREEVMDIYKEATIGASTLLPIGQYPSLNNLPTKVYEFMAAGLPYIISDFEYSKKVIEENNFGVSVCADEVQEIAEAIRYLNSNPDIAKEMGQNGRKAALERFNWSIEEEKLYSFYEKILG